jgi:hypothetical protein
MANIVGPGRYSLLDQPGGPVQDFKIPEISGMNYTKITTLFYLKISALGRTQRLVFVPPLN